MNKNSILGYRQEEKWIKAPLDLNLSRPFVRSKLVKTLGNDQVQYQAQTEKGKICLKVSINQTYDVCKQQNTFDDMCQMSVLNEPEVLNNLVQRYLKDQIFTYIGPTLLIINPYRIIPQFFSQDVMLSLKEQIIKNNINKQKPHVYYIAGQAYNWMIQTNKKQAIVISGQSGAGKTQSTKYCMQILTSLSHRKTHSIEEKILACNPLLEAFGNSKTVRNDNSSRFGKYVQIFFGHDYTIKGANISSYLLQKTRVVSIAKNQRSFHVFYALLASDKNKFKQPSAYKYLRQSECFQADNINQKQLYIEIIKSMNQIGFTKEEQNKIWSLVYVILQLGNIEFDDKNHQLDESQKCQIINKNYLFEISKNLNIKQIHLEQILLLEKKKFLKQYTFKPYNKQACYSNLNTLSKGIYNSIFEFILYKIEQSLRSKQQINFKSINILDIFGFQNFENNNFQQLCINFTNEKLLKLYNTYIFSNQMQLLLQDGLNKQVSDIIPPTNDNIINVMTGQLSLFSIINDFTTPQQFNDKDMIQAFESKLKNTSVIKFDKLNKHFFNVLHSQCEVCYNIKGFKNKNQDKIIIQIEDIVTKLFNHQNKQQKGKTLLNKFCKEIQDLMGQLNSSTVHFIRCIKPNDNKLPKSPNFHYIMTQIRYLGVFQTIQIRKKTFPNRKNYADFVNQYSILFPNISKINDKDTTIAILKNINCSPKDYMIGNHRIYLNTQTQDYLGKKIYEIMKIHGAKAQKIQRAFRKYKFKKTILKKLKILIHRIHLWKKIVERERLKLIRKTYQLIKIIAKQRKIKQQEEKRKKLINEKQKKDEINKQNLKKKHEKIILLSKIINNIIQKDSFKRIKQLEIKTQINLEKVNNMLNQTVMVDDSVINNESPYQKIEQTNQKQETQYKFNQSFLDQKSFYIPPSQNVIFKGNIRVNPFIKDKNDQDLCKLQKILMQEYVLKVPEKDQEYFSPISKDCNFKLEDTPPEMMNKVISFPLQNFFNQVLRKRTTFLGLRKGYMEILVAKPRPLTSSLTILNEADEQLALKIFKVLVRISEQNKLQNVFKLVDNLVVSCQGSSQSLKNQVFLQLIKQTNTNLDLASIRIYECMSVFLHIYNPENDYILAAMSLFYQKLAEGKIAPKEDDYLRYIFKKLIRKLKEAPSIGYMPIKYQLMALMCKRQISIPVYLPIGSSILIRVQSYETFGNIKQKVLKQFGIDCRRLKPQLFTFFEIVNFQNQQLEQSPIKENEAIWDIMTYWELAKNKYQETGIVPPSFFLMLKIKYSYQCNKEDIETIELFFAQTYFDYLIGRVRLPKQQMTQLAACVRLYKIHKENSDIISAYPVWIIKQIPQQTLRTLLTENIKTLESMNYSTISLKYLFLEICSQYSLTMSMAIPTDQQIKMYLRPKNIYITKNSQIEQSFPIKSIIKWAIDDQKFTFQSKSKNKNQEINKIVVMTQFASICSQYLNGISKLLTVNGQNKMQIL